MKLKHIIIAATTLMAASCGLKEEFQPVFTGKYPDAPVQEPVELKRTIRIADLAAKYNIGQPIELSGNLIIEGVVSTTDQPGNFYKSFYIQDETGGMEIKIGKNGLYNDYLPGQKIYVDCDGMTLGMYGYKSNYGNGMVQLGYKDPTGEYETSYLEIPLLINTHVYKGEIGNKVEPVVLTSVPSENATQATDHNIGKLVTYSGLTYGWHDSKYDEDNEAFALIYINSQRDKKASENRIFVSGTGTGITTWAMSKVKMTEYLYSGIWDSYNIGNANDYNYGTVEQRKVYILDGVEYRYQNAGAGWYNEAGEEFTAKAQASTSTTYQFYYEIERAAQSISHYFHTSNGDCIQIRTSGFSKFCDTEIDPDVLAGRKTIDVTGILSLYQGKVQLVVNSLDDIVVND